MVAGGLVRTEARAVAPAAQITPAAGQARAERAAMAAMAQAAVVAAALAWRPAAAAMAAPVSNGIPRMARAAAQGDQGQPAARLEPAVCTAVAVVEPVPQITSRAQPDVRASSCSLTQRVKSLWHMAFVC